jgi:hypothetical protein
MATGDTPDIVSRLRNYLAPWFGAPGLAPVLTAILTGGGTVGAFLVALIAYAQMQTRIATATGGWLNLIALDYFGTRLRRRPNQGDESFRARILAELLRPRVSRAAMRDLLVSLTGREPKIFEPSRPLDTGTYAADGASTADLVASGAYLLAWDTAGGWGDLDLPGQFFIDVYRDPQSGVPLVSGWDASEGGWDTPSRLSWIADSQASDALTDDDIYAAIVANKAEGTNAWVRIST